MQVEVVYASETEQALLSVAVDENATVEQAITASGILKRFPEIDIQNAKVGIFSKACKLEQKLREGDRVEIYRPLLIDPMQKRRLRAAKK